MCGLTRAREYQIRRVDVKPARFAGRAARSRAQLDRPLISQGKPNPRWIESTNLMGPLMLTEFLNPTGPNPVLTPFSPSVLLDVERGPLPCWDCSKPAFRLQILISCDAN